MPVGEDWPRAEIEQRLRGYYMPVEGECGALDQQPGRDGVVEVELTRGPSELRWVPPFDAPSFPQRDDMMASLRYVDSLLRQATFGCKLLRTDRGWRVERCSLEDAGPGPEDGMTAIAGCWSFRWLPWAGEDTLQVPDRARLTLQADTADYGAAGFVVAPLEGGLGRTWTDWGLGWRWAMRPSGVVELHGGGIFEGIAGQLVWDPWSRSLRGAASHWTDYQESPVLPDPDWRVQGTRLVCPE